jgi:hypothetical protein
MSDRTKLKKLNNQIEHYYYAIGERSYVHGTTIVSAIHEILQPKDVTVALRTPLTTGFRFDLDNTLQAVGWVVFENTCLFITPTQDVLSHPCDLSETQLYMLALNKTAQEAAGVERQYYSKRLTVDLHNVVMHQATPSSVNIINIDERNFQVRMLFQRDTVIEGYVQHAYVR